ncbi:hypothetical protein ACWEK5_28615 [Rhodococcus koreensis]
MTREAVIASVPGRMAAARKEWEENAQARADDLARRPWQTLDASEYEWRYGFDPNSGMPGARTYWHGRQWNWESWDGNGQTDRGAANRRGDAFVTSSRSADTLAKERGVPQEKLYEASLKRGLELRAGQATAPDQSTAPSSSRPHRSPWSWSSPSSTGSGPPAAATPARSGRYSIAQSAAPAKYRM